MLTHLATARRRHGRAVHQMARETRVCPHHGRVLWVWESCPACT